MMSAKWQLWRNQLFTVVALELKRNLLTKRSIGLYLLAFMPVVIIALHAADPGRGRAGHLEEDTVILAGIFQFFYLRLGIFFGCLGIFTWLIRGEMIHKNLHYYFLAPMRREILVLGKFIAGTLIAGATFATAVLLCFTL